KSKLLSATIYLANMASYNEMNEVWDAWVDSSNTPARATVEARLAQPKFLVEVSVVAGLWEGARARRHGRPPPGSGPGAAGSPGAPACALAAWSRPAARL